jgi:hypothetical protein
MSPSILQDVKKYYPLTSGIMILAIIILASFVISAPSQSVLSGENTPGIHLSTKNGIPSPGSPDLYGTIAGNGTAPIINSRVNTSMSTVIPQAKIVANVPTALPDPLLISSIKTVTSVPTPRPIPQYVTIEPVIREPDTSPKTNRALFEKPAAPPGISFDTRDYLPIFKNNQAYNGVNSYKISFNLKNPPMVIRYTVIPHNITDKKWFEPTDRQKKIDTAIINRPDEFAWFEMQIYENKSLYDKQGWGGLYGIPLTMQEIVIRNPGIYEIEFSGYEVTVNSEVLVKKEGNIEVF